jgi:hypothetical protein
VARFDYLAVMIFMGIVDLCHAEPDLSFFADWARSTFVKQNKPDK